MAANPHGPRVPHDTAPHTPARHPDQRLHAIAGSRWLPWTVIAAAILWFGKDFILFNKVFLPLDYLQAWSPWNQVMSPPAPIQNVVISDVAESLYPPLEFLSRHLHAGHIPLWNPDVFLGAPNAMLGAWNFVMNPIYLVVFRLFSPATGHGILLLANLGVIAAFSYLFFRQRDLLPVPALFGSLVLTFNGHLMVWLEYMLADFAYAGAAVALYCFERSLSERRLRFMVANAFVFGVLLLCGSVQWVLFLIPLIGLYAGVRTIELWTPGSSLPEKFRPLTAYVAPLGVGVLIALPNLWYFLDYRELSHRTIRTFEWVRSHTATFYPEFLTTFVFPDFFGYQPQRVYFPRDSGKIVFQNYNELCVYMGVVTLIAAAFAFRVAKFRWTTGFWLAIVIGALAVAMKLPGLYFLMYEFAPGFNGMQPTRTVILLPLAFASLSAIGLDGLLRTPLTARAAGRSWQVLVAVIGILILGVAGLQWYLAQEPKAFGLSWPRGYVRLSNPAFLGPLALLGATAAALWACATRRITEGALGLALTVLLLVDLVPFGLKYNTRADRSLLFPATTGLKFVMADREPFRIQSIGLRVDTLMIYGLSALGGYASMYPATYLSLLSAMEAHEAPGATLGGRNPNYVEPQTVTSPLLAMLNVKYVVAPGNADISGPAAGLYRLRHRSDLAVFEANRYLRRAFMVHHYEQASSPEAVIARLLQGDFDPAHMAVGEVALPEFGGLDTPALPQDEPPRVELSRPTTDRFEIDAATGRQGLLVISEQFFPGWEALIDGARTEIFRVNGALMGIVVPSGTHHITVRFFPRPYRIGLSITALAVGMLVTALVWDRHRASRGGSRPRAGGAPAER
jgi:hypothetical protein